MKLYTSATASCLQQQQLKRAVHVDTRDPCPEPEQSPHKSSLELHTAARRGNLVRVQTLLEKASGIVDVVDLTDADGASALLLAAREGHVAVVEYLLAQGAQPHLKDENQSTALQYAVRNGHIDVVKTLLLASSAEKQRTWIDAVNASGYAALHEAARSGSCAIAQLLLDHGADADVTSNGWRPLHTACTKNHIDVVQLLLAQGANVNAAMRDGVTALHYTARHGTTQLATVLLDAGADVNVGAGRSQTTPLHIAAMRGDLAMLQCLVNHGARLDQATADHATPFFTAAEYGHLEAVKYLAGVDAEWKTRSPSPIHVVAANGHVAVLRFLLGKGVAVDLADGYGLTPLCVAIVKNQLPVMECLLARGASVTLANAQAGGYTCLHYAAELGRDEAATLLVTNDNARIDAKSDVGYTPLHVAAMHGAVQVASVLLEKGADAYARGANEFTATHLAATTGQLGVLQYLVQNGYTQDIEREVQHVTPLALATAAGHLDVVKYLVSIQDDQDQETCARRRSEALIGAVEGGHLEIVKFLCAHGASMDVRATKDTTALHTAAGAGDSEVVEYLLRAQDADVHTRTSDGLTALHYASTAGHADVVAVLLAHGARVNEPVCESSEPDLVGTTPSHFAALYGHVNVLEALVRHGADLSARTAEGTGVVACAREGDNAAEIPRVLAFLRAHGASDE